MWNRQELKERGKAAFRANYWPNVLVAFVLSLLTAGGSVAVNSKVRGENVQQQVASLPQNEKVMILVAILGMFSMIIVISVLLDIFIFNPLKIGCYAFFKENVQSGTADVNLLKEGFSDYGHKFFTMFLRSLFIAIGAMLFVVPGIYLALCYRMVPYIVRDNPELAPMDVLRRSKEMMDGHKWNAFVLDLSFLGWDILSVCTLGLVGIFWANPYIQNTNAALYLELKDA
ncbi:MAG: DUF975 family protein [Mogibacterium sp.]|nr:DUF975 family protein [Mogibacterium sp.]